MIFVWEFALEIFSWGFVIFTEIQIQLKQR